MKHYDYFMNNALQITDELRYYAYEEDSYEFPIVCHGDYQYHNIMQTESGSVLLNFEKCVRDYPVRDLYLFLRKLLEKITGHRHLVICCLRVIIWREL